VERIGDKEKKGSTIQEASVQVREMQETSPGPAQGHRQFGA